ncbi:MAG: flagellar basal body-associated FliL family protein [Bacillota bacterium]
MKETEPKEPKAKGEGKKNILMIILIVAVVVVGAANYFRSSPAKAQGGEKPLQAEALSKKTLEPFLVNLADPGFRRYLRLQITIEYTSKELEKELEEKQHRLRDAIINTLRSKNSAELSNDDVLRKELLNTINDSLVGGKITAIYFDDLIIQ